MIATPEPGLYWAIAAVFSTLVFGSTVRLAALRNADEGRRKKRLASLRTWWTLAIVTSAGLLAGRLGICVLLAVASSIAWFELTRMLDARAEDRMAIGAGYVLIAINYGLILGESAPLFAVFLPLGGMFVMAIVLLIRDEPRGYIRSSGGLLWGLLFLGYGVSHAALLMTLPVASSGPAGPAGWFIFLVVLTETDDIFQAIVGRRFGAHKRHLIAPVVSPNKTWEGFFGGMLVIVILAPVISPWLTTLGEHPGPFVAADTSATWVAPILAAILISVAGFFGDINMSAIKRDAGVKDGSNLLPGMGGMVDRIDSLTMTAPVFVYFVQWWTG